MRNTIAFVLAFILLPSTPDHFGQSGHVKKADPRQEILWTYNAYG